MFGETTGAYERIPSSGYDLEDLKEFYHYYPRYPLPTALSPSVSPTWALACFHKNDATQRNSLGGTVN